MENIIEVKGLQKRFGQKTAINNINFSVMTGEIFGLLGPSGAGKTTMIKLLIGELCGTEGSMSVLQTVPKDFKTADFRSRIGVLSDNSALYERLTVYDNLKLFSQLYNTPLSRISEILAQVNLSGEEKTTVSKLSKGMKQRVLLAKAMIHRPKLLFLDEPTSALDPGNVSHIHRTLQALNEAGTTIFLNTHDMEEANVLCDRVAFLHQGKIQELDAPDRLRYKYSTHAFHVETMKGEKLTIANDEQHAPKMAELIKHGAVKSMHTDNPTLGQIFMKVTGKELV